MISSHRFFGFELTVPDFPAKKGTCPMPCVRVRNLFVPTFVFFCLAFLVLGQVDTGTILGTVTDATGAGQIGTALAAVAVSISSSGAGRPCCDVVGIAPIC